MIFIKDLQVNDICNNEPHGNRSRSTDRSSEHDADDQQSNSLEVSETEFSTELKITTTDDEPLLGITHSGSDNSRTENTSTVHQGIL